MRHGHHMCLQKAVGIGYCSCYRRRTEVALATMGRKRGCRGGKKVAKKPAYVLALLCCLVGCAVGLMSVSCAVCCVLCVPAFRRVRTVVPQLRLTGVLGSVAIFFFFFFFPLPFCSNTALPCASTPDGSGVAGLSLRLRAIVVLVCVVCCDEDPDVVVRCWAHHRSETPTEPEHSTERGAECNRHRPFQRHIP